MDKIDSLISILEDRLDLIEDRLDLIENRLAELEKMLFPKPEVVANQIEAMLDSRDGFKKSV